MLTLIHKNSEHSCWIKLTPQLARATLLFVLCVTFTATISLVRGQTVRVGGGAGIVSADGRFVISVDTSGETRAVYELELATGKKSIINFNLKGEASKGIIGVGDVSVSADGRYVAFTSDAPDLVENDSNGARDVFVRDTVLSKTILVSVNRTGTGSGNAPSIHGSTYDTYVDPIISADGRFVAFTSFASDLVDNDFNDSADLFVRDLVAQKTYLVSINTSGRASGNRTSLTFDGLFSFDPVISADGRYIAFNSWANDLVANDTLCFGNDKVSSDVCNGTNGLEDVFVRDLQTGTTKLVSVNRFNTAGGDLGSRNPSISADGRIVAFASSASDLVDGVGSRPAQGIYARDMINGTTKLVALGSATNAYDPLISRNGRFVVFKSGATDIGQGKTNFLYEDVFISDLQTQRTELVSINATGTNGGNFNSQVLSTTPSISDDGRFVLFGSGASDLVAHDTIVDTFGRSARDTFVRDTVAKRTYLISINRYGTASGMVIRSVLRSVPTEGLSVS